MAATLWGLDLGLVFSARWTFSGLTFFTTLAVLVADPVFGVALFSALWLGRASPIWVVALTGELARDVSQLLDVIGAQYHRLKTVNLIGVLMSTLILLAWMTSGNLIPH